MTDKHEYLAAQREIGAAYREVMGRHFPAMSVVAVAALLEDGRKSRSRRPRSCRSRVRHGGKVMERRAARWWAPLLLLACGTFASGTDLSVIAGILPHIARDLHVSVAAAGQMITVFAFAYALGSPVLMAVVAGGSTPNRLLALAIGAFALANVLAAVAPNIEVLALARALAALLAGVYVPSAAAAAAALVGPELRGRALALVLGGSSIATVLGVPAGVWIAEHFSWRATFRFVSLLALLALAGIVLALPAAAKLPKVPLRARLAPLARADVVLVLAVTLLAMTAGFGRSTPTSGWCSPSPARSAAAWSGCCCSSSAAAPWRAAGWAATARTAGARSGRWSSRCASSPPTSRCCRSARARRRARPFMFVWGVVGWGFVPPQQHRLIRLVPQAAPIVLSLNASAMYLGIGAGAVLGGLVPTRLGVELAGPGRNGLHRRRAGLRPRSPGNEPAHRNREHEHALKRSTNTSTIRAGDDRQSDGRRLSGIGLL